MPRVGNTDGGPGLGQEDLSSWETREEEKRSAEAVKNVVGTGELRQLSFYDLKFLIKIRRDGVLADRGTLGLDGRGLKRALEIRIVPEERGTDGLQSTS